MNTKVMFSSETDMWETPQAFFDKLNAEFNFTLDACAIPSNAKCTHFFTPEQDGLKQTWGGMYGATRPMDEVSAHGCKKHTRVHRTALW